MMAALWAGVESLALAEQGEEFMTHGFPDARPNEELHAAGGQLDQHFHQSDHQAGIEVGFRLVPLNSALSGERAVEFGPTYEAGAGQILRILV
jgi:hypothetical protein